MSAVAALATIAGARPSWATARAQAQTARTLPSTGTTLPAAPARVRLTRIATVEQPVGVVARPGDTALYVLEKVGRVRVLRDGVLDPVPALDLSARTGTDNERGLLGLAFHPADPALAYVDWTDTAGTITLTEYPVVEGRFDVARERTVLRIPKQWNDHNGGSLAFDRTGRLYVGVGDGGGVGDGPKGVGDPNDNAQRLDTLFGKILRIDPRATAAGAPYAIPAGNPFVGVKGARPEIWALGVRNPWRTSMDEAGGTLWVADVGQSKWEELNRVPLAATGANLGWRRTEGLAPYRGGAVKGGRWLKPVHVYPHADKRCAVIGGATYAGRALAPVAGWFVFGDLCAGTFSALRPPASPSGTWTAFDLGARVASLTSIAAGPDAELYATSLNGGVYRLDPA